MSYNHSIEGRAVISFRNISPHPLGAFLSFIWPTNSAFVIHLGLESPSRVYNSEWSRQKQCLRRDAVILVASLSSDEMWARVHHSLHRESKPYTCIPNRIDAFGNTFPHEWRFRDDGRREDKKLGLSYAFVEELLVTFFLVICVPLCSAM